jgi:hypothetical protein
VSSAEKLLLDHGGEASFDFRFSLFVERPDPHTSIPGTPN